MRSFYNLLQLRQKISIKQQLLVLLVSSTIIISLFTYIIIYRQEKQYLYNKLLSQVNHEAEQLSEFLKGAVITRDVAAIDEVIEKYANSTKDLKLIAVSDEKNKVLSSISFSKVHDPTDITLYRNIVVAKDKFGSIKIIFNLSKLKDHSLELTLYTFMLLTILLILTTIIVNYIVINPIQYLNKKLVKLNKGDYSFAFKCINNSKELSNLSTTVYKTVNLMKEINNENKSKEKARQKYLAINKQLEVANKHNKEFVSNMSHELRTPLNAILGFSELLDEIVDAPEAREYLQHINTSGKTLLRLINDILDLSKIDAGKLSFEYVATSIHTLSEEAKCIFNHQLKENNIEFINNILVPEDLLIIIDEVRIRQVLLNLLGNAIKFTHDGSISISAKILSRELDSVHLQLSVVDSGIGISQKELTTIFEPFTQTAQGKKVSSGVGIGLTITKKLVELMSGTINVTSTEGVGTSFIIDFRNIKTVRAQNSFINVKQVEFHNSYPDKNLLIVDDVKNNIIVVQNLLKDHFQNIYGAQSAKETIEVLRKKDIDIIIVDLRMPEVDGIDLAKLLNKTSKYRCIPRILFSAMKVEAKLLAEVDDLFVDYLLKPADKAKILKSIDRSINRAPKTQIQNTHRASINTS
ncbi:MAG: response regulator [Bacteriovoracaceae bacterium]|nr:response regulator [Bacteriovoracaceae bacterium]